MTIEEILQAKSPQELFGDLSRWKDAYKALSKQFHPDTNKEPGSSDAFAKLSEFKDQLERGKKHEDDAGKVTYRMNVVEFEGDPDLIAKSYENYLMLRNHSHRGTSFFKQYLPVSIKVESDNKLVAELPLRAIPLVSAGTLPQEHVNWVLSRMMELAAWFDNIGYSHAGFNPESIYIIPENHGMICTSFYHVTPHGQRLSTVSGRWAGFYPNKVFADKVATPDIDLTLAKKIAIYLLGDKSGNGVKLRKTHKPDVINFLLKPQRDHAAAYKEYRSLLDKHFDTKKFHTLNL